MPLARSYKFDAYICIGIGEELSSHYTIDWADHQDKKIATCYTKDVPDSINDHKLCKSKPDHRN